MGRQDEITSIGMRLNAGLAGLFGKEDFDRGSLWERGKKKERAWISTWEGKGKKDRKCWTGLTLSS